MWGERRSATAQHVALARAHLTAVGVIDDPVAETLLRFPWSVASRAFTRRDGQRRQVGPGLAFLAARTRVFDRAVVDALDDGIDQVVVLGAGYDSRAWRMARSAVRFIEVDKPGTQADKRRRAPAGGPAYVAADLTAPDLGERLAASGLDRGRRTLFTAEGVTMYLALEATTALLASLAGLGAPGSRLVVNFADRAASADRRAAGVLAAFGRERFASGLGPDQVAAFVSDAGWSVDEVLCGPALAAEALAGTTMAGAEVDPGASVVVAHRADDQLRPSGHGAVGG